ncbi:hypothetical protein A1D22_08540 [Pasteurellaceae bacterium LFhippo2]|nr:hypothetical protein [Pasteurellaceae bacterium LFhippo2]
MIKTINFKPTLLAVFTSALIAPFAESGVVRNDIDYQIYRDLAANKGIFSVGSSNFAINDKNGNYLGTLLKDTPMIDFSPVSRTAAVATAISNQYIASVAHNRGYTSVQFGAEGKNPDAHYFSYQIVDRNNGYGTKEGLFDDYHTPRLAKLITETAPAAVSSQGVRGRPYFNTDRFDTFLRIGSGLHQQQDLEGNNSHIATYYIYPIASTVNKMDGPYYGGLVTIGSLYTDGYAPLTSYGIGGDSGSPLFAYDKIEKQWVMVGTLQAAGVNNRNLYMTVRADFMNDKEQEDIGPNITNSVTNAQYTWQAEGNTSRLTATSGESYQIDLTDSALIDTDTEKEKPSLNNGKTFYFSGEKATITLQNNIDQGAGAIYANTDLTIKPKDNQTWVGAGISVAKDKQVTWQISNPEGDRLSKIGAGTLYVNGVGTNKGDISVGDGTVILAQQADAQGNKQAFNQVGIVSGRATVVLNDSDQVDPNKIYFGYRGGRLDVNGNSLTFNHIQNVDEGARIVNNNATKAATINLTEHPAFTENDIQWGKWREADKDLYEYINTHAKNRTDYFTLKGNPAKHYPTNQSSNVNWEFLSSDRATAVKTILERKNLALRNQTFNGFLGETDSNKTNGKLNFVYQPTGRGHTLTLNGGTELNGEFIVKGGDVILSGKPVEHAYDVINKKDVIDDNNWIDRSFSAQKFTTYNYSTLNIGRNVAEVRGNFVATGYTVLNLGFKQGQSTVCTYSEYTGTTSCTRQAVLSDETFANLPTTQIYGNADIIHRTHLNLGKADFHGSMKGMPTTKITIGSHSHWYNTASSHLGNLHLEVGSNITLNQRFKIGSSEHFNALTIDSNLTGIGQFNYLTDIAKGKGDHITVNGIANGSFLLNVKNSGAESSEISPISLLTLKNANQNNYSVNVALNNGYVDLGAYRYILANINNDYRLYSPLRDAQLGSSSAKSAVEQAQKMLANYKNALTQAEQELNNTLVAKQQASEYVNQTTNRVNAAQTLLTNAENYVKTRWFWTKARKADYLASATAALADAQTALANADSTLQKTTLELTLAQNALAQAKTSVTTADKTLSTAQANYNDYVTQYSKTLCAQYQSDSVCSLVLASANSDLVDEFLYKSALADQIEIELEKVKADYQQNPNTETKSILDDLTQALTDARNDEAATLVQINQSMSKDELNEILTQLNAEDMVEKVSAKAVTQSQGMSIYANSALSEVSSQLNALLQVGRNLDSELLKHKTSNFDVWANSEYQESHHESDHYRGYKQNTTLNQIGAEKALNDNLRLGLVVSQSKSNNDYAENVSGKNRFVMASLYAKATSDNGWFTTLDGSYARAKSQINLEGQDTKFSRNIHSVGLNLGKHWDFNGFEIQPSVGVKYFHLGGVNYSLNGAEIKVDSANVLAYNAGLKLAKTFEIGQARITPSFSSYYVDASHKQLKVGINNAALTQRFGRYITNELGLATQFGNWGISANAGLIDGNEIRSQKYAGFKLNYSW